MASDILSKTMVFPRQSRCLSAGFIVMIWALSLDLWLKNYLLQSNAEQVNHFKKMCFLIPHGNQIPADWLRPHSTWKTGSTWTDLRLVKRDLKDCLTPLASLTSLLLDLGLDQDRSSQKVVRIFSGWLKAQHLWLSVEKIWDEVRWNPADSTRRDFCFQSLLWCSCTYSTYGPQQQNQGWILNTAEWRFTK